MADNIDGAIAAAKLKIENGKLKIEKKKLRTIVADKCMDPDAGKLMSDNVSPIERNKINKKSRNDINPAKGAHGAVSNARVERSKEIGKNLGMKMT